MPFESKRSPLALLDAEREELLGIVRARTETAARVERAKMMLAFADGHAVSAIARQLGVDRWKVGATLDKALALGAIPALGDLPGRGRPRAIGAEARTWVVELACQKPLAYGYPHELWTTALLAQHARENCEAAGHPELRSIARGTISKLLGAHEIRPHKIRYYLEKRDPQFAEKKALVLCVYREIALLRSQAEPSAPLTAVLCVDTKPGIQALGRTSPDLRPVPGEHPSISRDFEYVRHGTMSLLAGLDLMTGHVHGIMRDRCRSREFIELLTKLNETYAAASKIRLILDNHSAHTSKETRLYLASVPNRFEFVFTPKHGSWLNLVEVFFAKLAKTVLRGMRVTSKSELASRLLAYLDLLNDDPVVFRWRYGLELDPTA